MFFGETECVNIIRRIGKKKLNEYSPEEGFILGVMLGYDRLMQCKRYLKTKEKESKSLGNQSEMEVRCQVFRAF